VNARPRVWQKAAHGSAGKGIEFTTESVGTKADMPQVIIFTQPGCLSCELMRVYLEARGIPFEERDVTTDLEARRTMMNDYDSDETPTIVIGTEVVTGFDPVRLDQLLDPTSSSDVVA